MKAAVRLQYGPPESLTVKEVAIPSPKDKEILVKVSAATANRTDCANLTGNPWIIRLFIGLFKPKLPVTGTDFAGQIEAIGREVKAFQIGDKVWGFDDLGLSSHAQYLCIAADGNVLNMPENKGFSEAVASIEGAHYALNFINKVKIQPGQKVLVNGATGAIGSAALQLVKDLGAQVTAVCDTNNIARIKALGADTVIDRHKADFTQSGEKFDFVLDAVGKSTFFKCKALLNPRGIYISSELGPWSQNIFLALITPLLGGKKVVFPIPFNIKASLSFMKNLLEAGKFTPLIDRDYPLEEIGDAFKYVASGQKTGNVIVLMG